MPIARKDIPTSFLEQMQSNLSKDSAGTNNTSSKTIQIQANEERKEKYADVMNIRLSKGRRNEIKTFCASCGISITQYIEASFEYLAKEVAAGRIIISKGGITRLE